MSYDNWRKRLEIAEKHKTVAERRTAVSALKINFSQPGEADCGYYRKPITEKNPSGNGHNIIKGWVPVSYFMHGDKLVGIIGAGDEARDMTDEEVGDEQLWSYVVSHPISYELYQDVVEYGGDWPDLKTPIVIAEQPAVPRTDNLIFERREHPLLGPAQIITPLDTGVDLSSDSAFPRDHNKPPELLPHVEHAAAIDNAIGAGKDLKATTAEEAAVLAGAANVLRDRRLAAEKIAKSTVEPLYAAYIAERDKWAPMVKRAKTTEDLWRRMVAEFETAERKRIAAEQLAALEKQREQDEANARAADRAIANAEPEPEPVVEDVVIPQAPQPVKPTYGNYRPATKPLKKFAVIVDAGEVYKYFANTADIEDVLQKLATNAVRSGEVVPGTTVREGTE